MYVVAFNKSHNLTMTKLTTIIITYDKATHQLQDAFP